MTQAGVIGSISTTFTADTRSFDASVDGVVKKLKATGDASDKTASKVKQLGEATARSAEIQATQIEKARRAFEREETARAIATDREIERQKALAEAARVSALREDILARSAEKAAIASNAAEEKAAAASKAFNQTGNFLNGALAFGGLTLGVGAAAGGLEHMLKDSMETAVALGKLNQQTGISVENLSILKFAAAESGVEFESLTRGFKKLAVTVYDADNGNKNAAKGFQQLGITVEELRAKGDDMYAVMALLADKFKEMPEGITKSDTAAKIFGARMGSEMIPVLNQGSKALEDFKRQAPIFSDADIEKMHEMHKATVELDASWQRLSMTLASNLAPVATVYMNAIEKKLDGRIEQVKELYSWVKKAWAPATQFEGNFAWDDPALAKPQTPHSQSPAHPHVSGAGTADSGSSRSRQLGSGEPEVTRETLSEIAAQSWADLDHNLIEAWREAAKEDRAEKATLQAAQGQADWDKFIKSTQVMPQDIFHAATPKVTLGQQPNNFQKFEKEFDSAFDDWTKKATDLHEILGSFVSETFNSINGELVKMMTTQYHQGDWKKAVQPIFTDVSKKGLEYGEGSLMKAFGIGDSKSKTMFVQDVGLGSNSGGSATGAASVADSASQSGGFFNGFFEGIGSFFGGMETGGLMKPGGFYLTGERGPELLRVGSTTRINNARDTSRIMSSGGGSHVEHHYHIDARGATDPAAVTAAINRAISRAAPQIAASSIAAFQDMKARRPAIYS
jgi:hypothetical protein